MTTINYEQARKLCTADEFRLVESCRRENLSELTGAALRKKIARARRLRDKWRDVSTRQRRRSQDKHGGRGTDENRRSRQKLELFSEVLSRLERYAASASDHPPADAAARGPTKRRRAH